MQYFSLLFRFLCYNNSASGEYGLVAQLGERTVRIREVRGFDPLQVHHELTLKCCRFKVFFFLLSYYYQKMLSACFFSTYFSTYPIKAWPLLTGLFCYNPKLLMYACCCTNGTTPNAVLVSAVELYIHDPECFQGVLDLADPFLAACGALGHSPGDVLKSAMENVIAQHNSAVAGEKMESKYSGANKNIPIGIIVFVLEY